MKRILIGLVASSFIAISAFGAVNITAPSVPVSADNASNASGGGSAVALGDIVIAEGAASDFSNGTGVTLILSAPVGWRFSGTITVTQNNGGKDIGSISSSLTTSNLTLTFTVNGTTKSDTLTISGLQVQSTNGAGTAAGTILRTTANPGTATIAGVTAGTTPFGSVSQTVGAAKKLSIQTIPSSATAGVAFSPAPAIRIEDQFGNLRSADTLTVAAARSGGTGTLQGTTNVAAVAGVATFTNLSHTVATNISVSFTSGALTSVTSGTVTINPAAASQLVFSASPSGAVVGSAFTTQPALFTRDAFGNNSSSGLGASKIVSLSLTTGTGPLLGTTNADIGTSSGNGFVTFSNVRVDGAGATNQLTASAPGLTSATSSIFAVAKGNQTITFGSLSDKVYGDPSFTVSATASSGLTVSNSIVSGPATIVGNQVTITGTGTVTVRASQAGNANYNAASSVDQNFNVTPATLTVTADNKSRVYGDTNLVLTATYTGFVYGESSNVIAGAPALSTTATAGSTVSGSPYAITAATGTLSSTNYTFSFVSGQLAITPASLTVTVSNATRAYGATNPAFSSSISGIKNGDNITASYSTTANATSAVGNYTILPLLNDPNGKLPNYNLTTNAGSLTVTAAPLSVSANNASRAYGASNPTFTGSISGLLNSDDITATYSTTATETNGVGTYPIVPSLVDNGGKLGNYSVTTTNGTLTVNPAALTGTADNKSRAYGSANPTFTVTYTGFVNSEDESVLTGALVASTTATNDSPVGTYPISASGQSAANYQITYVDGTLTVTAHALTVVASDSSRAYGTTNPVFTGTLSGVQSGDDITATFVAASATASSPVGDYAITPVLSDPGNKLTNYTVSATNGTLTVTKAVVTVTANDQTRGYGADNPTLTASYTGFVNGETNDVLSGSPDLTTAGTNASVGTYPIAVTAGTLSATNYTFAFVDGTLTVTPAALTATAANKSRAYGDVNPTFTASYAGFVNGDDESVLSGTLSGLTSANANSPVGVYPISISGVTASNYSITFIDGELTVTPSSLVVVADGATRTYGSTNPVFTGSLSGVRSGDDITATYDTVSVDATTQVGNYSIIPTLHDPNARLTNYSVLSTNGILTITKATIAVTADNKTRVYAQTNPVLTATYSGFVNGETTDVISGEPTLSTVETNVGVGIYPINASIGTLSALNYSFAFTNGSLTITPASLVATADNKSRGYGEVNPAFTASYSGFVNDDTTNVLTGTLVGVTPAETNSPIGVYPISISGVSATNYSITFVDGELTITPYQLIAAAFDATNIYGSTNTSFAGSLTGVQNGDGITATFEATNVTATSTVGTYTIVPVLHDPNNLLTNYTVVTTNAVLTIAKATLTATPDNKFRLYGAANPVFTVSYNGFVNGETNDVVSGSPDMTSAGTNVSVGAYPIVASIGNLSAVNYDFAFADGALTVLPAPLTATADNKSRGYGQGNPEFTASYSGFVNDDTTSVIVGALVGVTSAEANSPIGVYPISISGVTATNYSITFVDGSLTITPYELVAVANDATNIYGSTNTSFSGSLTGVQNGDAITATFETTNVTAASTVGTYTIVPVLHDPNGSLTNYSVLTTNAVLTVAKATLTATADNQTRVYAATNPVLTVTYTGFKNGETNDVISGAPNVTTTATTNVGVGTYPIVATLGTLSATNYDFAFVDGAMLVTPAPLVGQADNKARTYGASNPEFTATYSGFVNDDGTNVLLGTLLGSTPATTSSPIGVYPISVSGQTASNYTITYLDGSLTITPADLSVVADNASKVYGSTNPSFTGTLTGLLNADDITATFDTTGVDAATSVGTYSIVPTLHDSSSRLTNYTVFSTNATLTISKATLTVTADNKAKVFGSSDPVFTATYTGFQNADSTNVVNGLPGFTVVPPANDIGTYAIVPNIGTLSAQNYDFAFANGVLTVTTATLTVKVDNTSRVYGVANPAFTLSYSGFLNGDTTNVISGTPSFVTAATETSPIGDYSVSVSGLTASNYAVVFQDGTLTVTKATLTAAADDANRTYGTTNPIFTGTLSANQDSITATFTTAATTNSPVGTYPITAVLDDPNNRLTNYTVQSTGTLTVDKATLAIVADAASRGYGSANPLFTGSVSGAQNNEDITVSFSSDTTTSASVGDYPIHAELFATNNLGAGDPTMLDNYQITTNGLLTITNAPLIVTVSNATKPYGMPNPSFDGNIVGIQNGENITATYTTPALANSIMGTYPITATLSDGGTGVLTNYSVVINDGVLTIGGSAIFVSADNTNKVYGATNPVFTGTLTGALPEDGITVSYTTIADTNSTVGAYQIVPVLDDHGNGALTNYAVYATNGVLTVTKATLVITPHDDGVGAGTNTPPLTASLSGVQNNDFIPANVICALTPARLKPITIANYSIVVSNIVDLSSKLGNYSVTTNVGIFRVVDKVKISAQPVASPKSTVQQGMRVVMTVKGTGIVAKYQWRFNDIDIPGATTATNIITTATFNDAGIYTVAVTNPAGGIISSNLVLTVVPDTNAPAAAITKPSGSSITLRSTNELGTITAYGSASDSARVTNVFYRLNGSAWAPVAIFTPKDANGLAATWTNQITAATGTNTFEIYSSDWTGNTSKVMKAVFFFHVDSRLIVDIDEHDTRSGEGSNSVWPPDYRGTKNAALIVAPDVFPTNNASLYVNRGPYVVTAIPGHNQLFTNWTKWVNDSPQIVSTNAKYSFVMETNMHLTANFIHNPWMQAQGTYYGLFTNGDLDFKISGYITLKVTTNVSFSGKLLVDGDNISVSGPFNLDGTKTLTVSRAKLGKTPLTVNLQSIFAVGDSGTNQIVGTITDGTLTANIVADQWIYQGASTNPALGKYTMVLANGVLDNNNPIGYGYGLITVATNANLTVAGALADGTAFAPEAATISKNGRWPVFKQIYTGKLRVINYTNSSQFHTNSVGFGSYIGWLNFTNNTDIAGVLKWTKTTVDSTNIIVSPAGAYTNRWGGFTNELPVTGLSYVQRTNDPTNLRLISVTNALINFVDGDLPGAQSQSVQLKTNNSVSIWGYVKVITKQTNIVSGKPVVTSFTNMVLQPTTLGTNAALGKLAIGFDPKTGKMTGSFTNGISLTPTGTPKAITFTGVVLQPWNAAYGFFLGTNQSGSVTFQADPANP